MKTIEDFVDRLNDKYQILGYLFHKIEHEDCISIDNFDQTILLFDEHGYSVEDNFSLLNAEIQRYIINFLSTCDRENWFNRPLYNIILAELKDNGEYDTVAYSKWNGNEPIPLTLMQKELLDPLRQFNEIEIDELLDSQTDERLRKIIQLGVRRVEEKWKQYKT